VDKGTKKLTLVHEEEISLGVLIHQHVRAAVEQAVHEELAVVLGVGLYERSTARRGERNGTKSRTLTGPTGPLELTLPRARVFTPTGKQEWASKLVPRYQRRVREVNESVLAAYLSGANTRRIARALRPLLKAAPLSKSAVSRVVGTLKSEMEGWQKRSLKELDVAFLYLDAIALRVRAAGRVTSVPVLVALAVLESSGALHRRRQRRVAAGALGRVEQDAGPTVRGAQAAQPRAQGAQARAARGEGRLPQDRLRRERGGGARSVFVSKWKSKCPGIVRSLAEAGDELFTMYRFPKQHWKNIRTTNAIERLNGEFRRRVKTQGSLPSEDSALVLLYGLVATGQIRLRKIDGFRKLAGVISAQARNAA